MRVSHPASFISPGTAPAFRPLWLSASRQESIHNLSLHLVHSTGLLACTTASWFLLTMFYVLCRFKKEGKSPRDATLDGFMHVPARNETALAQAVSQHPVAVAVCCGDNIDNWHQYTGGIFEIPNTGRHQP